MADGGGVLLRPPRDTQLSSKLRVLRDPSSDLHAQATFSRKGRRMKLRARAPRDDTLAAPHANISYAG